jgi:hypothetical protein
MAVSEQDDSDVYNAFGPNRLKILSRVVLTYSQVLRPSGKIVLFDVRVLQ